MPKGQESEGQLQKGTSKLDYIPISWQQTIVRLKMQGKTNESIAKHLKTSYGYKAHPVTIGKWLRTRTDAAPAMMFKRESYVSDLESNYIEMLREFKKLSEFTWRHLKDLNEAAKQGDAKARGDIMRVVSELRSQIELANSLMGALPKSDEQIEDTAKSVSRALRELDKMGLIKKFEQAQTEKEKEEKKRINKSPLARDIEVTIPGSEEPLVVKHKVGIDLLASE